MQRRLLPARVPLASSVACLAVVAGLIAPGAAADEGMPSSAPASAPAVDDNAAATQPAATQPAGTDAAGDATPALTPASTEACPQKAEETYMLGLPLKLHGGLNLRTDLGVHPLRIDFGAQYGPLDITVVVDPMFPIDNQFSSDLLVAWRFDLGIAPIAGWRMTAIGLAGGPQLQQNLVAGVGIDLPEFFGLVRGQLGLEMAAVVVKHGGGLPTEILSFESARHYLDLLNFGMFARYEFAVTL